MSEAKENWSGWVKKTLEELLECESLEEVMITLTGEREQDRGLMQQVFTEEVRQMATRTDRVQML